MKHIISLILLFTSALLVLAQPQIKFNITEYDYGSINEDGGIAETVFEFTNTGNQPLVLNNVKATCGCTTPEWTKSPIAPNQKGTIKVGYNPQNRPGAFSKNLNVYSNTQPSVTILTIKGKVEPRQKSMEEIYQREMGPLRWKSNYLSLGTIYNAEKKDGELELINNSATPAKLEVYRTPEHISVKIIPETIPPGKEGKIIVTYDAAKKNAFGYVSDRVYLSINNEKENTYSIGVSVSIQEDFSKLTPEQLEKAPVAKFSDNVFDFGTIQQGEKAVHNFKLTNSGKTDLIIRNVKASCGCTAVKHENVVKPGQTIDLTVEFNSRGKRSRQNKSVTVITNDPKNSTTVLRVMGNVEAPAGN